jgi:hypothetical protein
MPALFLQLTCSSLSFIMGLILVATSYCCYNCGVSTSQKKIVVLVKGFFCRILFPAGGGSKPGAGPGLTGGRKDSKPSR